VTVEPRRSTPSCFELAAAFAVVCLGILLLAFALAIAVASR
jgi:hypothetical protein